MHRVVSEIEVKKMTVDIKEILNWVYSDYKDVLVKVHHLKGKTIEDVFKQMYAMRRSGRYDNERRYEFSDRTLEGEYNAWKKQNETIDMYYGCGTVD